MPCKFNCYIQLQVPMLFGIFFYILFIHLFLFYIFLCFWGVANAVLFFFISKSWRFVLACKCNCYNCRLLCSLAFFFVVVFVFGVANAILFFCGCFCLWRCKCNFILFLLVKKLASCFAV